MSSVDPRTRPESDEPVLGYARVGPARINWRLLRTIGITLVVLAVVVIGPALCEVFYNRVTTNEYCSQCGALREKRWERVLWTGSMSAPSVRTTQLSRWIEAGSGRPCAHIWNYGDVDHYWARTSHCGLLYPHLEAWSDERVVPAVLDRMQGEDAAFRQHLVDGLGDPHGEGRRCLMEFLGRVREEFAPGSEER